MGMNFIKGLIDVFFSQKGANGLYILERSTHYIPEYADRPDQGRIDMKSG
jgi:hypothetical protein